MSLEEVNEGFGNLFDSVAERWRHLRESAASALTRFKPALQTQLPAREETDDPLYLPARGWSILGGEVFEDDKRRVVRLEVPGMEKQNIAIDARDDALIVSGESAWGARAAKAAGVSCSAPTAASAALCWSPCRWTPIRPGRPTGMVF